jgi:hypothetical protein
LYFPSVVKKEGEKGKGNKEKKHREKEYSFTHIMGQWNRVISG